ncbi:hypothetical protein ES708_17676 [subsurface metagenome]
MDKNTKDLKQRILEEMTVNYSSALEKNFDYVKKFIKITSQGKIDVLVKDELNIEEQVILYLIGKLYAKEAEISETEEVTNIELSEELGLKENSLRPKISSLREQKMILTRKEGKKAYHSIKKNIIESTLKSINYKN